MSNNTNDDNLYWSKALERRMNLEDETTRLLSILKGFYYEHLQWESDWHYSSLRDFYLDSKRPYGNKSIEESIAFNLGWDFERHLCQESMPEWVKKETMKVHFSVGERLKIYENI